MFSCTAVVFLLVAASSSSAIRLGRMVNATFSSSTWTNRSCNRCLCDMLANPTLIVAVSCPTAGQTCQMLFSNSTTEILKNDSNVIYMLNTNWTSQIPSLDLSSRNSVRQATWKFDGNFLDAHGIFNGVPTNNPTFLSPGIDGGGSYLYLNASMRQSVTVPSPPFLNMSGTSFTVSVWINPHSWNNGTFLISSDNVIFAQNDHMTTSRSLHLILRYGFPRLGFYDADASASTTVRTNRWTHLAFVYDYALRRQFIYVDGILNKYEESRGPYNGTSGSLTIGTGVVSAPNNSWDGCLDQMTFQSYAKNASDILRDATLTVSYAFEQNLLDQGPLANDGNGTNVLFSSPGRVSSHAANFNTTPSYVKTKYLVPLSSTSQSFTFALWINPRVTTQSSTLIQLSTERSDVFWTMPLLGFVSSGYIRTELCSSTTLVFILGPLISTNVWTHLAVTYNATGNFALWINGTIYGSALWSSDYYSDVGSPIAATIGGSSTDSQTCGYTIFSPGQYFGLIDQFQVYSRVLSSNEILALANT